MGSLAFEDHSHNFTPGGHADSHEVCWMVDLGLESHSRCMQIQSELASLRKKGLVPDCLLLVEHPHTITLGRAGNPANLLATERQLKQSGVVFSVTDRGGDITYHGPGQMVAYPILDLKRQERDVERYLRRLESCIIETLSDFGIAGERRPGATGVWIGGNKITAIGVRISQWVTSHGLALNVNTDLSLFSLIVPCGLQAMGVTSMQAELGQQVDLSRVKKKFCESFGRVFFRSVQSPLASELDERGLGNLPLLVSAIN